MVFDGGRFVTQALLSFVTFLTGWIIGHMHAWRRARRRYRDLLEHGRSRLTEWF